MSRRTTPASQHHGISAFRAGLMTAIIIALAAYLNFAKSLPWTSPYQVKAVFKTANNIKPKSPVRVAGVNVGKVSKIEQLDGSQAVRLTMAIEDQGRPVHRDATMKIRPRLFLEGNFFVDLKPGSPDQPEVEDGGELPVANTATPVQFEDLLRALQSDTREDLQLFLKEYGEALDKYGGARGFNQSIKYWKRAFRDTARVSDALQGTEPHDLSGFVKNTDKVVRGLIRNEQQLKDLVTNFRITAGSFAAEDVALQAAIRELPQVLSAARPALSNLNASFPGLRGFARDILPGVRNSEETLDASQPFIEQARRLVGRSELRGLVADLKPAVPSLASLVNETRPLLEEVRALSSCFDSVVNPWSVLTVPDPENPATGKVNEEFGYGLVGVGGESRSGDANGQIVRVLGGGGATTVAFGPDSFAQTLFPILGQRPAITSSARTPFKPEEPCENQDVPNLDSGSAAAPPPSQTTSRSKLNQALYDELNRIGLKAAYIERDRVNARTKRANGQFEAARKLQRSVNRRYRKFMRTDQVKLLKLLGMKDKLRELRRDLKRYKKVRP